MATKTKSTPRGGAGGSDSNHGVQVSETSSGLSYIKTIATSIIGLVATAADADADMFPLNKPVLVNSINTALAKAGTTGTLYRTLNAISKITNPVMVIVRVEEGADEAETTSNVIGKIETDGTPTGLQALLVAKQRLGYKPRIIGVPYLDNQAVITELAVIAKKLKAFAYAKNPEKTVVEAGNYRTHFSARELMLVCDEFTNWNVNTSSEELLDPVAVALGTRAWLDATQGWHKSISNVAISGVTGINSNFSWDLQDPNTDVNLLNGKDVTCLINFNGPRFWGNRTCDTEGTYIFEVYTRTAQILAETVAEAHFRYVDGVMIPSNVVDIVESVSEKLRQMVTNGQLLGGRCWFEEELNPITSLKTGRVVVKYNYTPVPPMEDIQFIQEFTDEYWIDFVQAVTQQISA